MTARDAERPESLEKVSHGFSESSAGALERGSGFDCGNFFAAARAEVRARVASSRRDDGVEQLRVVGTSGIHVLALLERTATVAPQDERNVPHLVVAFCHVVRPDHYGVVLQA